jgi:dihydroorotase
MKLLITNGRVFYHNKLQPLDILIQDDLIIKIAKAIDEPNDKTIDATNLVILPGFIDIHTHLREPGFEYKEDIESGTKAAAAGGFTTICCMPNLNPVTDSVNNIKHVLSLIMQKSVINVLPYAAITKEEKGIILVDIQELSEYCFAFSDDGVGVQSSQVIREAMVLARQYGKCIATHCELLNEKDAASEYKEVERNIKLAKETGCHVHICHISCKESVDLIRKAKANKINITCEVTPHHLLLNQDNVHDDGSFKMNPPLRTRQDQEALVLALSDNTIDVIATDHAPHSQEEKSGGYQKSLNGIIGLEHAFSLIYTNFVKTKIITFKRMMDLFVNNAKNIFKIGSIIDVYQKADLTLIDLEQNWQIDSKKFLSKGRSTPFNGQKVNGKIIYTIVNGRIVYGD